MNHREERGHKNPCFYHIPCRAFAEIPACDDWCAVGNWETCRFGGRSERISAYQEWREKQVEVYRESNG